MNDVVRQSLRDKTSNTTQKGINQVLEILNLARDIFIQDGYSKLSMRGVATQAGIALSSLQHYFKTKDGLVEAMLLHVFEDVQNSIDEIVAELPNESPIEQFTAAMRFVIEYVESDEAQQMFFELGALASRYEFAATIMDKMFTNAQKAGRRAIRNINPDLTDKELSIRAAMIVELLMGSIFIVGKHRPRSKNLRNLEQRTLQAMIGIAVKEN